MKWAGLLLLVGAACAFAHPMGNFSVSHYARFEVSARGVDLLYVLDLAELPTFDLLRSWKLERDSPRPQLQAKAREQAGLWLEQLRISRDGKPVRPRIQDVGLTIADGAGNLPILRITMRLRVDALPGTLAYEDLNFPDRAGWKEIVIQPGPDANLIQASHTHKDISKALTEYPPDPTVAPPQDLRAELKWSADRPVVAGRERPQRTPATASGPAAAIVPIPQPKRAPVGPAPAATTTAAPPGSVVRGDFLSRLLHQREITPWMMFAGIAMAFVLGAAHALTPGHGKTIVAAYLVGSRGTLKHAAFLGGMVTLTHTISVFALGLATLFLFRYVMPEKITEILGVISGLSIVAIGGWMFYKRWRAIQQARNPAHAHPHRHDHDHAHDHGHAHSHDHGGDAHHHHPHDIADHHHHHGPGGHTHMPDEISWAGLVALGASGGLVPCESALILLLGAVALGRVGLGLLLLVFFSLGLAIVLMAIGAIVLYARNLIPEGKRSGDNLVFRWLPLASAAAVVIIGVIMTEVSIRWTQFPRG